MNLMMAKFHLAVLISGFELPDRAYLLTLTLAHTHTGSAQFKCFSVTILSNKSIRE